MKKINFKEKHTLEDKISIILLVTTITFLVACFVVISLPTSDKEAPATPLETFLILGFSVSLILLILYMKGTRVINEKRKVKADVQKSIKEKAAHQSDLIKIHMANDSEIEHVEILHTVTAFQAGLVVPFDYPVYSLSIIYKSGREELKEVDGRTPDFQELAKYIRLGQKRLSLLFKYVGFVVKKTKEQKTFVQSVGRNYSLYNQIFITIKKVLCIINA